MRIGEVARGGSQNPQALYYAALQEAGEFRQDEALLMGPELGEPVAEIRVEITYLAPQLIRSLRLLGKSLHPGDAGNQPARPRPIP